MPTYNVHFDIVGIMVVSARNPDEAKQIALDDTLRGIDTVVEVGDCLMKLAYIDLAEDRGDAEIYKTSDDEESFQCPNCDTWGYDVKKAYCKICDAEEEENV